MTLLYFVLSLVATINAFNNNFNINLGTFLGESSSSQLYPVAVGILSDSTILVAGNGNYNFGLSSSKVLYIDGLSNSTSNSKSNGTILFIESMSNPTALGLIKIGPRLDTLRVNPTLNHAVISGSFGVAVIDLSSLKKSNKASLIWLDTLIDVPTGSTCDNGYNTCCYSNDKFCLTDIGKDDTVSIGIVYAGTASGDYTHTTYDPSGKRLSNTTTHNKQGFTSTAVSTKSKAAFTTVFYDSSTGKEHIVMPGMTCTNYRNSTDQYYSDYYGNPHEFRTPGYACNGDVADARALIARPFIVGGKEYLYYVGRSDGGDSLYHCSPHNYNQTVEVIGYDAWTQAYNMGSQAITFLAQMNIETGDVNYGEFMLTREPGNTKGNTLVTNGIMVDSNGYVYLAQSGACCSEQRNNLTVNNQKVGNYSGGDGLLQIISKDFKTREYWTAFNSEDKGSSSGSIDIDLYGNTVAMVLKAKGNMITEKGFSGTKAPTNDEEVGYLVAFETVSA